MHLRLGSMTLDTNTLPEVFLLGVDQPYDDGPVRIDILLAGRRREAVQQWANALGAQVTERDVPPMRPGDRDTREVQAVLDVQDGPLRPACRVAVWLRTAPEKATDTGGAR